MKQLRNNYFRYETKTGWTGGTFNIYQASNGSIVLPLADVYTVLTYQQLQELFIDLYILKDFDHDLFLLFYQTPIH